MNEKTLLNFCRILQNKDINSISEIDLDKIMMDICYGMESDFFIQYPTKDKTIESIHLAINEYIKMNGL